MAKKIKFTFNEVTYEMEARQKLFCLCYVKNKLNGTKAAIEAGYSENGANVKASQLLTKVNIQSYIAALKEDIEHVLGITAIDIAREYARIGFSDVRKLFDENGNVIEVKDFEDDTAANVASIEVFEEYQGHGEDRVYIGRTKKIQTHNKVTALDKLARMIGKDGIAKVASVDSKGKDVKPPEPSTNVRIINIDPNDLTTEQLEKLLEKS